MGDQPDKPVERERRQRVLKGGTILTDINVSAVSCTIRNMNSGGAELRVDPAAIVPEGFLFYVPTDQICYRCEVRWRKWDRIGVRFVGTQPKPRWLY